MKSDDLCHWIFSMSFFFELIRFFELKLTSTEKKARGTFAPTHFCATDDFYRLCIKPGFASMDLPSRSRANHAVQYVCPQWTWRADELIHIREMSERTSVPASSLRYYEKLGLITSERETSGSQRRYSKSTFYKIILITLAQSAGFNLDEIAEQLRNLPDTHPLPPKVWGPLHTIWERRIDQRVAELKQLKINLRRCTRDASR
jgi:MerR family redox-sensitive transcriptional activator SoxR